MILKLTLDRFEGNFAICIDENGEKYEIPADIIANLSEGDIFTISADGDIYSSPLFLEEETKEKRDNLKSRLNRLFKK